MTVQRVGHCLSLYLGLPHYRRTCLYLIYRHLGQTQPRKRSLSPISPPPHPVIKLVPNQITCFQGTSSFLCKLYSPWAATLYKEPGPIGDGQSGPSPFLRCYHSSTLGRQDQAYPPASKHGNPSSPLPKSPQVPHVHDPI